MAELFSEVSHRQARVGSRAWYVFPLSVCVHAIGLTIIVVVPLMATDLLPTPRGVMDVFLVPAAPPPPPPPPPSAASPERPDADPVEVNPATAPLETPREIGPETGIDVQFERGPVDGVDGGLPGVITGDVVGGLPGGPPPPAPAPPPVAPVRVGGDVQAPTKVRHVPPLYPGIAQAARVEGIVIIEATIGPNGRVQHARVIRSIPLLDQAALDAVRQWVYTPPRLNGAAVPVIMTVTVHFALR